MDTAIKRHGGKAYLAKQIVALMPPRCKNPNKPSDDDPGWLHYVEPYAGGLAVLFANDREGISEVVNDLDGDLTNFWRVLAGPHFDDFARLAEATPFCQDVWQRSGEPTLDLGWGTDGDYRAAINFFVRNRQSRQGLEKCFATLTRNRARRGMNAEVSAWLSAIEGLPEFHARLKRVVILNDDAVKVIKQQDGPRTLYYLDPPYTHNSRSTGGGEYKHEMSDVQHSDLLATIAAMSGRFILSGYHSDLYDSFAERDNWRLVEIEIDNKASGAKSKEKKTECLWMNY